MSAVSAEVRGECQISGVGVTGSSSCSTWMLGTEFRFSTRAIHILSAQPPSLLPKFSNVGPYRYGFPS